MENNRRASIFAITKEYDEISHSILTLAGVIPINAGEQEESITAETLGISWKKALWDTGATQCCISDRLATELDIPQVDFVDVATAAGIIQFPVHKMHLILPNNLVFHDLEAIGFTYADDDCDLIIGMDIMTQGDLSLTNMEGRTVFSFRIPSLHVVDFEAEHSR
jgi:hypothetical protein